jgi:hypothetical protein
MKITHTKLNQVAAQPAYRGNRLVTICAQLGGPTEFMTVTVSILNTGSEREICESGIARA